MCHNLPAVWPDAAADGAPNLDTVAEWLTWFGEDAQRWWGGLSVTTDCDHWQLGDPRPVRAILAGATTCRTTRRPDAPLVTELILRRLPTATASSLRQAIATVRMVRELATPLRAAETHELLQQLEANIQLEPPPASAQSHLPIDITHVMRLQTPADLYELAGHIDSHGTGAQRFVLLEPIGEAAAALDACLPPGSEARWLLDEMALTAPELGQLALRIADHLDGLARTGKAELEPVPMAGIVLHAALGELLRHPQDDPWEQVVAFYRGLWLAVGQHLARVRVETLNGGIWTSSRWMRLREVLAGQERCTIAWSEQDESNGRHACLDLPISEELSRRWRR